MSGIRRLEVADITKSGAKGAALVAAVSKMNTCEPPAAPVKKQQPKKKK